MFSLRTSLPYPSLLVELGRLPAIHQQLHEIPIQILGRGGNIGCSVACGVLQDPLGIGGRGNTQLDHSEHIPNIHEHTLPTHFPHNVLAPCVGPVRRMLLPTHFPHNVLHGSVLELCRHLLSLANTFESFEETTSS